MIDKKKVLAIVPARSGSIGLPKKNIKKLLNKHLIGWSIEQGLKCKYIDKLIVSTDSKVISKVSKKYGATVDFLRPKRISTANSPSFFAIEHAINFYQDKFDEYYDYLVLLEPTQPIRKKNDISNMIRKLHKYRRKFDCIYSVGKVKTEHPILMKKINNNRISKFYSNKNKFFRRQDFEEIYFPYGIGYVAKTKTFLKEKTFYSKKSTFFKIEDYQNYEIDDIYDFICVESVMKHLIKEKIIER